MANFETKGKGVVSRVLPQHHPDRDESEQRYGRYGEQYGLNPFVTKHLLADEGCYFVGSNQAPGAVVAEQALKTAFANTVGIFHAYNMEPSDKGKSAYFDFLKLVLAGTAPTGTVSMEFAIALDNVNREPVAANRTPIVAVNPNPLSSQKSVLQVSQYLAAQPFTVAAPTANVKYIRGHVPTGLGITGDEYILKSGGEDLSATPGLTAARLAVPGRFVGYCAPVIIPPGWSMVVHRWWLTEATTIPSFELEACWWER